MKIMDFDKGDSIEFCGCASTTIEDRGGSAWIVKGDDVMAVVKGFEADNLIINFINRVITYSSEMLT